MKTVINTKTTNGRITIYRMIRRRGNHKWGIDTAVTQDELVAGRKIVAMKLWHSRRMLNRAMEIDETVVD